MTKAGGAVHADKLRLYEKLVATLPGVARKGATVPYTSVVADRGEPPIAAGRDPIAAGRES